MPKKINLSYAATLPSRDAIAYFESKGYKISFDWWEIDARTHAQAFTVAHTAKLDVLQDIRRFTQKIFDQGLTEAEFLRVMERRLRAKGWWGKQTLVDSQGTAKVVQLGSLHRLKTIYHTNKRNAYSAAIYKQQKERSASRPYWMYSAILDSVTRPRHRALNGRVFRHDDPIWDAIYPPNGFGCRCRVRDLSEYKLKQLGLKVESSQGKLFDIEQRLGVDKFTGEEIWRSGKEYRFTDPLTGKKSAFAPDPGWSHNPGQLAYGADIELMQKLTRVPDRALRSQVIQLMNNNPIRRKAYETWAEAVLNAGSLPSWQAGIPSVLDIKRRPGHGARAIGLMSEDIADYVRNKTGEEPARIMAIGEKQLVHADAEKHRIKGVAMTQAEYLALPLMIADPKAVLWDNAHDNLLYVYDTQGDSAIKIVVEAPMGRRARHQVKQLAGTLDVIINAYRTPEIELRRGRQYEVVKGWKAE